MSYILEALRRAQAERERGLVPGLEAQPVAQTMPEATRRRWLPLAGACVLLLLVGLLSWALMWRASTSVPVAAGATVVLPAGPASAAVTPPIVVVSAPPPVSTAPTAAAPAADKRYLPLPAPASAVAPVVLATTTVPPAAVASSAPPRSLLWAQLSAEQRSQLPAMTLGGAIWSESAASRFVIVNGQVQREGDSVAAGVLLERIGAKAIWLRWRDLRIEVPL